MAFGLELARGSVQSGCSTLLELSRVNKSIALASGCPYLKFGWSKEPGMQYLKIVSF